MPGLRPSADALRETLFNWLEPQINGAQVLDVFAGTGVLGLEAISRGAASATLLERHPLAYRQLQEHAHNLQAGSEVRILRVDSLRWLAKPPSHHQLSPVDLVFIDPPFYQNLVEPTLERLVRQGWLSPGAWVYVEQESERPPPGGWDIVRERTAGMARGILLAGGDCVTQRTGLTGGLTD